ncbi:MAG: amidohydrolase [Thermoanaerobaculaceae bacterium]|nr:amidohydrolase [Thermoanaerobaculaceae bacterium]TAM46008.1 MAG: amidohydrolase [Acidobacteriota bacterium]
MGNLAAEIDPMAGTLVEWRRDFHRHPELAFEERRTSAVVRAFLESLGIEVRACGRTGLRGVLRGGRPGRTVALRADMDALPVAEIADHDYASENPGVMHACGHDGHMAILMGAAKVLASRRPTLPGTVVFLFQPAEENPPGGAALMIEEGALEGVESIFGLHLWQPLPTGVVGLRAGASMAQADDFEVVVRGRGGHASQPDLTVDPVVVASHVVVAAQTIVSRFTDPRQPVVVSFTTVHGGRIHNIIPDEVTMTGTVRTLDPATQLAVRQRLGELSEATCRLFGATAAFTYKEGYPPVINDAASVDLVRRAAALELGGDAVRTIAPAMGGEDFAYYLQRVPGAFALLGMGDDRPHPHHNARFDIDETMLPVGVRLMTAVALEMLQPA